MEASDDGEYHQSFLQILDFLLIDSSAGLLISYLAILVLLVLSAMISGAEVAFFSISPGDRNELESSQGHNDHRVINLLNRPRYLLATILIGNNLVNIGIIITSYLAFQSSFDFGDNYWLELLVNTVAITFVLVVFGEVLPKVYAQQNNIRFARLMSGPLMFMRGLFRPFSFLLVKTGLSIEKNLKKYQPGQMSLEEIDMAIDLAVDETTTQDEVNILKGIVQFGNISTKQVMHSRVDIVSIDIHSTFHEVLELVRKSGFSRIPVFKEDLDHIKGVLYAKDLLAYLNEESNFDWRQLIRPAFFVPERMKIDDLLSEFRDKHIHLALVVDEYGGTVGLVTLEDVMEEIIGEIRDEYDNIEEIEYEKIEEGVYEFEGKTMLNDICRIMEIDLNSFDEVRGDADSLAGLILEISGGFPDEGDEIKFDNYRFRIISANHMRLEKIGITVDETTEVD